MVPVPPSRRRIDMDGYPRADILRAFMNRQMPQMSLTCEVEVTAIHREASSHGVSFFIAMSYAISRAVNAVPQFKHRVVDGVLYEYERIDPAYTIAREGDLFSFCNGVYIDDFGGYSREACSRIEKVKAEPDLAVYEKHHMFFISCLPWMFFTSVLSPYDPIYSYVPQIAFGKFMQRGDVMVIPMGVQAHHGVIDAAHVARFFAKLEAIIAAAAEWLV